MSPQVDQHLERLQTQLNNHQVGCYSPLDPQGHSAMTAKSLPKVVGNISWAKSMQQKIEHSKSAVLIIGGASLSKSSLHPTHQLPDNVHSCLGVIADLTSEVSEYCNEKFAAWQVRRTSYPSD